MVKLEAITATPIFGCNAEKKHWLQTASYFVEVSFHFHFHYFYYLDRVTFIKTHRSIFYYLCRLSAAIYLCTIATITTTTTTTVPSCDDHHHFIVTSHVWIIFAIVYVNCKAEYSIFRKQFVMLQKKAIIQTKMKWTIKRTNDTIKNNNTKWLATTMKCSHSWLNSTESEWTAYKTMNACRK